MKIILLALRITLCYTVSCHLFNGVFPVVVCSILPIVAAAVWSNILTALVGMLLGWFLIYILDMSSPAFLESPNERNVNHPTYVVPR